MKKDQTRKRKAGNQPMEESLMREAWAAYERYGYNTERAAEALGISRTTLQHRVKSARIQLGLQKSSVGVLDERAATPLPAPKGRNVKRYILTCAQNNTRVHEPTLDSLEQLAKYWGASIKVSTFTYTPADGGSTKRGHSKRKFGHAETERWYDPRIEAYISDAYELLAPGLVWCGHSNTLPTASDPLTGTESMNGRASGVWPHTTIQMRAVATMNGEPAKFNYTTGTVTLRNYIQKRAGLRADFHHAYGALLIEVAADGHWWARQLNADLQGTIYDLGVIATPTGVKKHEGVEAIVFGDIHEANKDADIVEATWGKGGLVDALRPRKQVYHDLLDFESRSHHNRNNPHERFRVWVHGRDSVSQEVKNAAQFLVNTQRPWAEQYVVSSNHDRHLERWLRETDWRDDMTNAEFYIDAQRAMLAAIRAKAKFQAFPWAAKQLVPTCKAKFLEVDESLIVLKHIAGGIELGLHGDLGPNGARGTPRNLSKLGRKTVIGDKHCLTAGHTALVRGRGWVCVEDVRVGDFVSVQRDGRVDWSPVLYTHAYKHTGPVVEFGGPTWRQETTLWHNLFMSDGSVVPVAEALLTRDMKEVPTSAQPAEITQNDYPVSDTELRQVVARWNCVVRDAVEENVFCLTTETGNFWVRHPRTGQVSLTGNSPGIYDGCYVAGMTGSMDQGYNIGPSSWAPAHVVVYPNAKRQVIRFWNGAYSAEHYCGRGKGDAKTSR